MVKINLLPIRTELRQKALIEHIILIVLCVLLVFILSWFVQASITHQRDQLQKEVAQTKTEIKKLTAEAEDIEKFKKQKQELERKLGIINDLKTKKSGPVEILDQLSIIVPDKLWITSLKNTGDGLMIEGKAIDNAIVATFMKQLQSSQYFFDVELDVTQQEGTNNKFSIKCKIKLPT